MKKRIAVVLAALMLAALAGCSGLTEALGGPTPTPTIEPTPTPSPTPEPICNPLTGETGDYVRARPVAVTLQSGEGSLPYWGISRAGLFVEGVSQGYAPTRMAVFARLSDVGKTGPVGKAQDLTLQFALPLNAVTAHIDKTVYAGNLLNVLRYQDLDGLHLGKLSYALDTDRYAAGVGAQNGWYTSSELMQTGLDTYGQSAQGDNTPAFRFGDRQPAAEDARNAVELTIGWSADSVTVLRYDSERNVYVWQDGSGATLEDANGEGALDFTNVLVLYASSGVKDDNITRQYDLSGGTGLYLYGGGWQTIRWTKGDATAPLELTDEAGEPLAIATGTTYLGVWGGYYGQTIRLTAADGGEQTLPEKPALLESGVPDEVAQAAEQEYQDYLNSVVLQAELEELRSQLAQAQTALDEANAALEEDPGNEEKTNAQVTAQAIVDQLTAKIQEKEEQLGPQEEPAQEEPAPEESAESGQPAE